MIDWMPDALKRLLDTLLRSSAPTSSAKKPAEPYVGSGGLVFGSDLYNQVREEDRKRNLAQLAEDAEAARKLRDLPNS